MICRFFFWHGNNLHFVELLLDLQSSHPGIWSKWLCDMPVIRKYNISHNALKKLNDCIMQVEEYLQLIVQLEER